MGNRACIIFFDAQSVSPTVYLHWHGDAVPAWLLELKDRMTGRYSDASYAAARFVGLCHGHISGNLGLGLHSNRFTHADLRNEEFMASASPGNAGMVVVDTRDFSWRAYFGHLSTLTNEKETTMKLTEPLLSSIARTHLHIPTLECRRSDHLDFHTVSVWAVESALLAAFKAGEQASGNPLAKLLDDAMDSDEPSFTSEQIEFIRQRLDHPNETNQPQLKGES